MKSNYQIIIEYEGTNYNGWQYQKNGFSIQKEIEKALKRLLKKNIKIIGSGRTDSGVHAFGQSANFITDKNNTKTKITGFIYLIPLLMTKVLEQIQLF